MAEMMSWLVSSAILLLVLSAFYGLCAILDHIMKPRETPIGEISRWECGELGQPCVFDPLVSQGRFCRVCGKKLPPKKIGIFYPD